MARRASKTPLVVQPPDAKTLNESYEMVPVEHLIHHPDNPNEGDTAAVMASIRKWGFWGSITVSLKTRHICAGNHRYDAAVQLGFTHVPVTWVNADAAMEKQILATDNRTAELAKRDDAKLAALLADIQATDDGLEYTGYDDDDLDRLIRSMAKTGEQADRAKSPEEALTDYNAAVHGREIHLAYTAGEYNEVINMLEALIAQYGLDSYSAVIKKLLEDAAP